MSLECDIMRNCIFGLLLCKQAITLLLKPHSTDERQTNLSRPNTTDKRICPFCAERLLLLRLHRHDERTSPLVLSVCSWFDRLSCCSDWQRSLPIVLVWIFAPYIDMIRSDWNVQNSETAADRGRLATYPTRFSVRSDRIGSEYSRLSSQPQLGPSCTTL